MRLFVLSIGLIGFLVLVGAGCSSSLVPEAKAPAVISLPVASSTSPLPMATSTALAFPGVRPIEQINKKIRIKTTKGDIRIQIDPEAGPNAASNFVYLVEQSFYRGGIFHRVIPGFMIQGGDPTGTGFSGPGYSIPDDVVKNLPTRTVPVDNGTRSAPYYPKGLVAMANKGTPGSGGSQFFIMVADYPLPPSYSVFAHVIEGQGVADAIAASARDESDRPIEEVRMIEVTVE